MVINVNKVMVRSWKTYLVAWDIYCSLYSLFQSVACFCCLVFYFQFVLSDDTPSKYQINIGFQSSLPFCIIMSVGRLLFYFFTINTNKSMFQSLVKCAVGGFLSLSPSYLVFYDVLIIAALAK